MPLSGLKVVDLSRYLPGPYASYLLADYGADVVKVEQPHEIAKKRKTFGQDKLSETELRRLKALDMVNRNKRAVALSFREPAGRDVVRRMAQSADVFLHDYRPGVMEAAGLGYEDLRRINPRLIYCAVSALGQSGPYRDLAGHDPISLALTGVLTRFGRGEQAPAQVGAPVSDIVCALHAVIGILMALNARRESGRGQLVDVAMGDAAFALATSSIQRLLANGAEPPHDIALANNGLWRTSDGKWVCTTDIEPAYWRRFCEMVERPDLIDRIRDRPAIDAELQAIFASRTRDEWFEAFRSHDTQGAAVLSLTEALEDPHARARGNVVEVDAGTEGAVLHLGPLIKLSETPGRIRRMPVMPGADTCEVLTELGFDAEQIACLETELGL